MLLYTDYGFVLFNLLNIFCGKKALGLYPNMSTVSSKEDGSIMEKASQYKKGLHLWEKKKENKCNKIDEDQKL